MSQHATLGRDRFEILRELGTGGMGVVYEAFDRQRKATVAIKALRSLDARGLLLFKNEFRALQDMQHPNLVELGELFEEDGTWFFSMELVRGVSFLRYVRPNDAEPVAVTASLPTRPAAPRAEITGPTSDGNPDFTLPRVVEPSGDFDEARLRDGLSQLAAGLRALHANGMVHRDVKPSNVLVTEEGRVVILDFGLIVDRAAARASGVVLGTPSYMAPEQAAGEAVGPEADWYAVGVVLFRGLTGRLPFTGSTTEILEARTVFSPPPPSALVPEVPDDLNQLCAGLLRMDPRARYTGVDILETTSPRRRTRGRTHSDVDVPLIGRGRQRAALQEALATVEDAASVTVVVRGESGIGKSALIRAWTEDVTDELGRDQVVVLRGRCYERESVPYKAVDHVIDALSHFLADLDPAELQGVLPDRCEYLAKVFPALGGVEALARAEPPEDHAYDPPHVRRVLFASLRELFERLARRRLVIIAIDDFQWADMDSLALLGEVLRAPGMLLVMSHRDVGDTGVDPSALPGDVRFVEVDHLDLEDGEELARALLPDSDAEAAESIAREAGGHPLFIAELCRMRKDTGASSEGKLDDALWARVERLTDAGRRLLELVAIAGARVTSELAATAADIAAADLPRVLSELRAEHCVASTLGPSATAAVETFHDRVRTAVMRHLSAEAVAAGHRALAQSMEQLGDDDAERLYDHWRAAGAPERAADYATRAADRAAAALAFDRAVRLYREALELIGDDPERARSTRVALGEALIGAGRGAEAARAFLAAAEKSDEGDDLRRRAAEQLLRSGHVQEGLETMRETLAGVGMRLPATARSALPRLLMLRGQLRLRGLGLRRKDPATVEPKLRTRIDTAWSAAVGLSMIDPVRGAVFQTRMMLDSLRAGDPEPVIRALSLELGHRGSSGNRSIESSEAIVNDVFALAEEVGTPEVVGLAHGGAAMAAYLQGRFDVAFDLGKRAHEIFSERCVGSIWESDTSQTVMFWSMVYQGRYAELHRMLPIAIRDALARDDRYAATSLQTGTMAMARLADDDPDGAEEASDRTMTNWADSGFLHQHWDELLGRAEIDVYRGDGAAALERVDQTWPAMRRSMVTMIQISRCEALSVRGRAALLCGQSARAQRDARRLMREGRPWSPLGQLLLAGVRASDGGRDEAIALLEGARAGFTAGHMHAHAAVAALRLGTLRGTKSGVASADRALQWLADSGVRSAERFANALAPGF